MLYCNCSRRYTFRVFIFSGGIRVENRVIKIIENSKVTHPLAVEAALGGKYWKDFQVATRDFEKVLTEKEFDKLLEKSQLDQKINLNQYLQFSTEFTVVDYIIRNYYNFKYEPQYNGKKNPECSFEYEGRTINVEVKCPDLSKRIKQETSEGIALYASDRFPTKDAYSQVIKIVKSSMKDGVCIQPIDRLDNKLKDYLTSAHGKFPDSSFSNFNVLVIAVEIISDMDEWYSYLFGTNGAFTDSPYITEDYSNVDAVLITNVQAGHKAFNVDENNNKWMLENYISLLFLNPQKEKLYELGNYYIKKAINLFGGLTRSFLQFQLALDEKNQARDNNIDKTFRLRSGLRELNYLSDKIIDLQIISEWIKTLKNQ